MWHRTAHTFTERREDTTQTTCAPKFTAALFKELKSGNKSNDLTPVSRQTGCAPTQCDPACARAGTNSWYSGCARGTSKALLQVTAARHQDQVLYGPTLGNSVTIKTKITASTSVLPEAGDRRRGWVQSSRRKLSEVVGIFYALTMVAATLPYTLVKHYKQYSWKWKYYFN